MTMTRVLVTLPQETLDEVDEVRGREARASWIREAIRRMLEQEKAKRGEAPK